MTVQYKSKGGSRRGIEGRAAQTVLIICLLITLFLTLLPVIITIFLSFKSQLDMTTGSIWSLPQDGWHFDNYANAFSGTIRYMLNTLAIVFKPPKTTKAVAPATTTPTTGLGILRFSLHTVAIALT